MEEIISVKKIKHQDLTNHYISKDGGIYNKDFIEVSKTITNGYFIVKIKKKSYSVHRLVALTYIKNPNNYPVVNHIDENKLNNNVKNLEWVTQKQNCNSHSKSISHERKVIQKDLEGNVINIYNSVTEAGHAIKLTRHSVNKVCLGINKTAGGYKWEFVNNDYKYINNVDLTNAKVIQDFENYYIFPNGQIYNLQRKSFMKNCINDHGSNYITLSKSNEKKNKYVHNLVATYFIDNPENLTRVKHKDNNKNNNNYNNLEWF